ncbi:hypothetical protein FM117_05105 [Micrococcus luteus Mu201]|nr:hypothetical protein FM117_05105 [Micrococcus luteus Mu201]
MHPVGPRSGAPENRVSWCELSSGASPDRAQSLRDGAEASGLDRAGGGPAFGRAQHGMDRGGVPADGARCVRPSQARAPETRAARGGGVSRGGVIPP